MIIIFIFALVLLIYTYFLYPVGIRVVANFFAIDSLKSNDTPVKFSVILPVYNEALIIARCLDALLTANYPQQFLEIVIGSDCSSDDTDSIVRAYSDLHPQIKLVRYDTRRGKEFVLNDLVVLASNEVLLFVDADVEIDSELILEHAKHYGNPEIGAVAGLLAYQRAGEKLDIKSERRYQAFEEGLRSAESRIGSTIGLYGGNYSMRRESWRSIPSSVIHDDFYSVLALLDEGKRIIFEPRAIVIERYARTIPEEFRRRARFAARGLRTLTYFPGLLLPTRGWISLMLWSHKMFRWFSPMLFALLFVSVASIAASSHSILFLVFLGILVLGILGGLLGSILDRMDMHVAPFQRLYWFMMINAAFAVGIYRFAFKTEKSLWKKTTRASILSMPTTTKPIE